MRRANAIQKDQTEIETVEDLTGVFESLASTQVAKIKTKVELSKEFFDLIWSKYSLIRVDPKSRITQRIRQDNGKNVFVVISAEAGLSGDIDQRLIETVLKDYDPKTTDLIVLGSHGAQQLMQRGIRYTHYFRVPETDSYVDVSPVIKAIEPYKETKIYYEEYLSLGTQGIKKMDLIQTIHTMSDSANEPDDVIAETDTVFEPSLEEIADSMEQAMMTLAFSQAILESSLAQDASRFNAMAVAKKRAMELVNFYKLEFHQSKRSESDRRMREVMISLKRKKRARNNV